MQNLPKADALRNDTEQMLGSLLTALPRQTYTVTVATTRWDEPHVATAPFSIEEVAILPGIAAPLIATEDHRGPDARNVIAELAITLGVDEVQGHVIVRSGDHIQTVQCWAVSEGWLKPLSPDDARSVAAPYLPSHGRSTFPEAPEVPREA